MPRLHPFSWLPPERLAAIWWTMFAVTVVTLAALLQVGAPLRNDKAPRGVISLQLAGDLSQAREIVESWGEEGRVRAGFNLGLDYLFLATYGPFLALSCALVTLKMPRQTRRLVSVGFLLAWLQLLAALLDAVENYALIRFLLGSEKSLWPAIAVTCAVPKFALVSLGILYSLVGFLLIQIRGFVRA